MRQLWRTRRSDIGQPLEVSETVISQDLACLRHRDRPLSRAIRAKSELNGPLRRSAGTATSYPVLQNALLIAVLLVGQELGRSRGSQPDRAAADAVERCALGPPQESEFMAIANVLDA